MALRRSSSSPPATVDGDWTVQAADTIERLVGSVRDKTTVPATTAARGVVYGLLAAIVGLTALVLLIIVMIRVVVIVVDIAGGEVWMAYAGLGAIFSASGLLLLRRARRPSTRER